jgi:Flp pilus assembly pilin Flp
MKSFLADESGAVTVDWVVLTAAVVGLGAAIGISIATSTLTLAEKVGDDLSTGRALIEHGV